MSLFWIALVVSLDSLVAGISYGMQKVVLSRSTWIALAGCTALLSLLGMGSGVWLAGIMTPRLAGRIGGVILVAIGLLRLSHAFRRRLVDAAPPGAPVNLAQIRLPFLGVVVSILRDPLLADQDASGRIDTAEGVILGVTLGLDAWPAGLSAAMLGLSYGFIPLAAAGSVLLCRLGQSLGRSRWGGVMSAKAEYLPGMLLVILGLRRI